MARGFAAPPPQEPMCNGWTQVSMPTWRLGEALCKLVPMVAGTNVFVSTLSITAIALDRFHLIVHPTDGGANSRIRRIDPCSAASRQGTLTVTRTTRTSPD